MATASSRLSPLSHRWVILSMTIIELSTIIPTLRMRPAREMMLMLMPMR